MSDGTSTRWGLSGGLAVGFGVIGGFQGLLMTLLDVTNQTMYPIKYTGAGLVAGLKGGLSVSTTSFNFFTTSTPVSIYDFSARAMLASAEFTPIIGGSATVISFWGIDHDPYWISIGGLAAGVVAGAGIFIGKIDVYPDSEESVVGAPITPGSPSPSP